MFKLQELSNPDSCLNKARDGEMLFVLRAHDTCAPAAIRYWIRERLASGKNQEDDPQIIEATETANEMEHQQEAGI